jgi:BirA family transcriptional regulator, biotin operon repressor / biotin---[acetyl-CoA-carboxylase] ligase
MIAAAELARSGCPSGAVVGADEQTSGVGRLGRSWNSPPESGLYVSIVLRLPLAGSTLPLMMLALGIAVKQAIECLTSLACDLRWPNDVLIKGSKCAGILAHWEADAIIAGIGINVSQKEFPSGLDTPATSLLLQGVRVKREDLLVELLESVDSCVEILPRQADEILRRFLEASSYAKGRRVRVQQEGRTLEGVTCGLDASGFLLLREDSGAETTILAGGVRPV